MCVHARKGRENFGCFLVLLQYCIIYIYMVVVWTAVCLTSYSDYLTGSHERLSTSYICHTRLKTVYRNHWQSFGWFVIMMQWSLLYTLYDCHYKCRGLSQKVRYTKIFMMICSLQCFFFVADMFRAGIFLAPSAQLLFLVLLFVYQGGLLSLQKCLAFFFFFLMSLLASSLSWWWRTVAAKIKIPYVENPER